MGSGQRADGTTSETVKLQNVDFSGKTGTAQTESFDLQNKLGKHLKENGWFIGIAPRRNPEIVVAALVQGAGWGSSVAPIVRDVVKAYYDKKTGHFQMPAPPQPPGTSSASVAPPPTATRASLVAAVGAHRERPSQRSTILTGSSWPSWPRSARSASSKSIPPRMQAP